jgi:hypothetical protein
MTTFDWYALGQFKARGKFPDQYPANTRTFYSPEDDVHGFLTCYLSSLRLSSVGNMYGYDDDELNSIIISQAKSPKIYCQWSLDKSQAQGAHERVLVAELEGTPGTNVAIGESTRHAISHLKVHIGDGTYVVTGSTNWSLSGEQKQDNALTVTNDPILAAEYRAILDRNHVAMLTQMGRIPPTA